MRRLGYLASPYTHADPAVREQRFLEVAYIAAQIMAGGDHVICPITMCHPMAVSACPLPGEFDFWHEFDENIISRCDFLAIAPLEGWEKSTGIKEEIEIARRNGLEIFLVKLGPEHNFLGYDYYKGELDV